MCGLGGIFNKEGEKIPGKHIVTMSKMMRDRYDGRGGGFAAYGIYPKHKDHYALQIFLDDEEAREVVEEYLKDRVNIVKDEEVPVKPSKEIPKLHYTWRYFVDVPERYKKNEADYIIDTVMTINSGIEGAYVASNGKNMGVFKATGLPDDVARFFQLDKYKAYSWTTHGRFPTNTRGWWGGAHPFNILDWSVVHNGEISSYGTNRRYVEMNGYRCEHQTDTEVVAYLLDLLVRKQKMGIDLAAKVLAPPFWNHIDRMEDEKKNLYTRLRQIYGAAMLNGPSAVIATNKNSMIGLNDRIKLRPLLAAEAGDFLYLASEESAIREVSPDVDRKWMPKAGNPVVARLTHDAEEEVCK